MPLMTNQAKMEFIMEIYRLIFGLNKNDPGLHQSIQGVQPDPKWTPWIISFKGRCFKNSTTGLLSLRGFDTSLDIGKVNPDGTIQPLNLRFIEQNPDKLDNAGNLKPTAIIARQGNQLMWVIQRDVQNGFLGKVLNSKWEPSTPRAVYPSTNPQTATDQYGNNMTMERGQWINNLPNITKSDTIQHVIENTDKFENDTNQEGGQECEFVVD